MSERCELVLTRVGLPPPGFHVALASCFPPHIRQDAHLPILFSYCHLLFRATMGSTTSQVAQVPSPGRPDRRSVPPRPPSICQSCWDYPFAAHLGLFGAPGMIMEPSDPDDRNGKIQPVGGYSYSTSWEAVKSSAAAGCLWCQLLLTHCYYPTRPRKRIKVTVGTNTSDASTVPITPKNTQFLMIAVDVHNITMAFEGYVYTSAGGLAYAHSPVT